jgi:hypothetical protein
MKTLDYKSMRYFYFILFLLLILFKNLNSSPILFVIKDERLKKIKNCSTKDPDKFFEFEENHFSSPDHFPDKEIKKLSEYQGRIRFSQIECIRNLKLSQTELSQLKTSYSFFIERELEGLEILSNFFISQDKKNVYAPGELSKVKEQLKFKNDLYNILNKKTEDYLFYGEDNNVTEFISIYQSLIRLQYDLLNSVSKNVRQNILLK